MLVVPVMVSDVPGFIESPLEKVRVTVGVAIVRVFTAETPAVVSQAST